MRIESCLLWRRRRMTWPTLIGVVLAVAYLAVCSMVAAQAQTKPAEQRPAGSFEIPAWAFDRGNARVDANPDHYADYRDTYPELVAGDGGPGNGGRLPWVVEYDVDFPVDATYTLHVRYAAAEPRPMELWLDGRKVGDCCGRATGNSLP